MIRTLVLAVAVLAACALSACGTPQAAVTGSLAAGGIHFSGPTGLTLGYAQGDFAVAPTADKSGNAIITHDACGAQQPISTYSILNGNANATSQPSNGLAAAVAVNRAQATGDAASELATADVARAVGPGYDVERARRDCSKSAAVLQPGSVPAAAAVPPPPAPAPAPSPSATPKS